MPEAIYDLREIARSALGDMPEGKRAAFLAEMLTEIRGPDALDHLSKVRAAVSLRMQELIDVRYLLHELAELDRDPSAVHAPVSPQPMSIRFLKEPR